MHHNKTSISAHKQSSCNSDKSSSLWVKLELESSHKQYSRDLSKPVCWQHLSY